MRARLESLMDDLEDVPLVRFVLVIEDNEEGISFEASGDQTEAAGLLLRAAMHVASNPNETRQ